MPNEPPGRSQGEFRSAQHGGCPMNTARLSGFDAWKARLATLLRREADDSVPVRDWIKVGSAQPTRLLGFDQVLVWVVVALLALGLVMVYSATVALPDNPKFARYTP